jgi:hypothetical protein
MGSRDHATKGQCGAMKEVAGISYGSPSSAQQLGSATLQEHGKCATRMPLLLERQVGHAEQLSPMHRATSSAVSKTVPQCGQAPCARCARLKALPHCLQV